MQLRTFFVTLLCLTWTTPTWSGDLNDELLDAKTYLSENYSGLGYDIHAGLTHELPFADEAIPAGPKAPQSMCVAAVIELIIHAFDIYKSKKHDATVHTFLAKRSWEKLAPTSIKSHIWVDPNLKSFGTADALTYFGIGKHIKFSELKAGDFANINRPFFSGHRSKPSGHAVLFLSYVDDSGKDISDYKKASGFRYFSNQSSTNGYSEKIGFFLKDKNRQWFCPSVPGASVDCGIMYSDNQKYLNLGRLLSPDEWDPATRDIYLAKLKQRLYAETKTKGPAFLGLGAVANAADFDVKVEQLDDGMTLGALYESTDF